MAVTAGERYFLDYLQNPPCTFSLLKWLFFRGLYYVNLGSLLIFPSHLTWNNIIAILLGSSELVLFKISCDFFVAPLSEVKIILPLKAFQNCLWVCAVLVYTALILNVGGEKGNRCMHMNMYFIYSEIYWYIHRIYVDVCMKSKLPIKHAATEIGMSYVGTGFIHATIFRKSRYLLV